MIAEIRQSELRDNAAAVLRRVAAGETFVVTVNGRPVADVVPHRRATRRRRFVSARELGVAFADLPDPDLAAWRGDLETAEELLGEEDPTDPFAGRG